MVEISKINYLFALIFLFWSCANQLPPSGGDVDRIPPEVIESYPKDRTTNFKENYFEIKFSEYVDRLSVQNAIFISPALKYGFEFSWSGKKLILEFRDTLQQNTTYTVTVGTEVVDINNRNKLAKPYTFTFSTGEKIDTAKISGKVYAEKPSGVMIFAYKNNSDFNPSIQKPNYISQVGENGKYVLDGLSDGDYKILAVRDKSQDLLYNSNEDQFGVQCKEIKIDSVKQNYDGINFLLSQEDTIAPKISSAFMKDRHHLIIEFNEAIDSTKLTAANFQLVDSLNNKKILPKYFYKFDAKPNQFYLVFDDSSSFQNYVLEANNFFDLTGNKNEKDKIQFIYKNEMDTIPTFPIKILGEYSEEKIDYENPTLKIQFNDGIDLNEVIKRAKIVDAKKNNYELTISKIDDALFQMNINEKLKQANEYFFLFDARELKDFSNKMIDTTYRIKFTTSSELDFSGISGKIIDNDSTDVVTNLTQVANKNKSYKQKLTSTQKFEFSKVIPGKYLLWIYKDKNKNGRYDFGKVKPFSYSEEFKFYSDTLNLRARWPVGDLELKIDN